MSFPQGSLSSSLACQMGIRARKQRGTYQQWPHCRDFQKIVVHIFAPVGGVRLGWEVLCTAM